MNKREPLEILITCIFIVGGFLLGIFFESVKCLKFLQEKDAEIYLLKETINQQEKIIQADETLINNLIQFKSK